MSSRIKQTEFQPTQEQMQKLNALLEKHRGAADAAVTVLEEVQQIFGYLPEPVLKKVGEALGRSTEEMFGIGTFYSQFSLYPKGKYNFAVCMGTACYVNGSNEIFDRLKQKIGVEEGHSTDDGKLSISAMRCVGCCGLAPVMTVNEEVYGKITPAQVDAIVEKYKKL